MSRKREAAIGGTRRTGSAAYRVHTTAVTTFCDEVSFPALAATDGRRAAKHGEEAGETRLAS